MIRKLIINVITLIILMSWLAPQLTIAERNDDPNSVLKPEDLTCDKIYSGYELGIENTPDEEDKWHHYIDFEVDEEDLDVPLTGWFVIPQFPYYPDPWGPVNDKPGKERTIRAGYSWLWNLPPLFTLPSDFTLCRVSEAGEPIPPDSELPPADSAIFIDDINLDDNTVVPAGQQFTKTWQLGNNGNTVWDSNYRLVYIGGSQMGAPNSVSIPQTNPGTSANISVNIISPSIPGAYYGNWQLHNGQDFFGPVVWVKIIVGDSAGPTPIPSGSWQAEYYNTHTCWDDHSQCNNPGHSETLYGLDKNWGAGSPGANIGSDNWTGKFNATINFPSGEYVFYADHDDGLKIKIGSYGEHTKSSSGTGSVICDGDGGYALNGDVLLEVFLREEGGDANVNLWWSTDTSVCGQTSQGTWQAEFFNTHTCWDDHSQCFNSNHTTTIPQPNNQILIESSWSASPGGNTSNDFWTGRFRKTINFPAGEYVFYADHDDGLILKVGNYGAHTKSSSGTGSRICNEYGGYLLSGDVPIDILLREDGGDAAVKLWWDTDTTVCLPPVPVAPTLQTPTDGDTVSNNTPTFAWNAPSEAKGYQFQIDDDSNFANPELDVTTSNVALVADYLTNGTYYWRVRAHNAVNDWGDWSSIRNVIILSTITEGDLVVTGTAFTDNTRTALSNTAHAGQNVVSVQNTTTLVLGDELLIIQMAGAGAGQYEFAKIDSINALNITLSDNLQNTYTIDSTSKAQLIKVPHYQSVTILSGGKLTANAWNGTTGGIVALKVDGTLTVEAGGLVDASGLGFPGGPGGNEFPGSFPDTGSTGGSYLVATPLNGSTGDDCGGCISPTGPSNGGGGRGGQGSRGSDAASGGGGGSYGTTGTSGQNAPLSPFAPGGQAGLVYGSANLSTEIYLGSGGGGGGKGKDGWGGTGGAGGGIVIIEANHLAVEGAISVNGQVGANDGSGEGGGGGAGSGGSVYIRVNTTDLGTNNVVGNGGIGGNGARSDRTGNGGNGGSGRVYIEHCNTITGSTSPAANIDQQVDCMPIANFAATPITGTVPFTVTFTDQSVGQGITDWLWSFGDGSSSTSQHPTHTYTTAGVYTATLTVVNSNGSNTLIGTNPITVNEVPPMANFDIQPISLVAPARVSFIDESEGPVESVVWDFGDGSPVSTEQSLEHIYDAAGVYTVTMTANGPGGIDVVTKPITISSAILGDADGNGVVDVTDLSAINLEIFDNDGNELINVPNDIFSGSPGADANQDGIVDAGDVPCTVLIMSTGSDECGNDGLTVSQLPRITLSDHVLIASDFKQESTLPEFQVKVPITFTLGQNNISSLAFSLNIDLKGLNFNPTDNNGDNIPDMVDLSLPNDFGASVNFTQNGANGRLDFFIADETLPLTPLPETIIATITIDVISVPDSAEVKIYFPSYTAASFGHVSGISIPGITEGQTKLTSQISKFGVYLPIILQ